jgi:thiol-disulfide isomerase/thioredoxin
MIMMHLNIAVLFILSSLLSTTDNMELKNEPVQDGFNEKDILLDITEYGESPTDIDRACNEDEESTVTDEEQNEDYNDVNEDISKTFYFPPAITHEAIKETYGSNGLLGNESAVNLTENATVNITDRTTRKIVCLKRNKTENVSESVQQVNSTELLLKLNSKNDTSGNCAVVMFYAPWCMFCAETAPHYNALARAFPEIDVLAIDAIHFNILNARFGTIAVPNILVFHNSKAVARFNSSTRTLETMMDFVANVTGLEPLRSTEVTPLDYEGPLGNTTTKDQDYLLCLAWIFIVIIFSITFSRSHVARNILIFFTSFAQEHHQHID